MNKTLSIVLIIWMVLSITENVLNLKPMKLYEERQEELDAKDEELSKRLRVYERVSDPKTVQFYVTELNKIVDNMHRLGKIIDSGEEIGTSLSRIEKDYTISLDKVNSIYEIIDSVKDRQLLDLTQTENKISEVWESIGKIEKLIDKSEAGIISNRDAIKKEISKVNQTLNTIKKSKIGGKIFGD